MAAVSPTARALRDLQKAIYCFSGKEVGDFIKRALKEERDANPEISSEQLASELWCWVWEKYPKSFRRLSDRHSVIGLATLYSQRSAPETIERVSFTRAERTALRHARHVIAEAGRVPELVSRRWQHLVGLKGGPLDLTFFAAEPNIGGAALCWDPCLAQTAVYPHDIFDMRRSIFNAAEVVAIAIHEEVHLALSTRHRTRAYELSPLCCAALELAADTSEAIAFGLASDRSNLPTLEEVVEYLSLRDRMTVNVLKRVPHGETTSVVLQAMVAMSTAAEHGDTELLSEAQARLRGRVSRRTLENMLGLS